MDILITCFLLDISIQLIGFSLAFAFQTEKFYDLFGSLTYLLVIQLSLQSNDFLNDRQVFISVLASLWAVRLGVFLFCRVLMSGGDKRFDKVKTNPVRFLIYWLVQAVWVFLTILPVLLVNRTTRNNVFGTRDYIGVCVWAVGFVFEVVADYQKFMFKLDPTKEDTFISHGLWSVSRHPNYFGEIVLWIGSFILATSGIEGWEWICVISPIFVYKLITSLSGVPILERNSKKKFGHLDTYKHYISTVPVFTPFIGRP